MNTALRIGDRSRVNGRRWRGDGSERRRQLLLLALACTGSFVVIMDATVVSVALPDIRIELGFSATSVAWVVNAYTLAFAGLLLLGGRCADVFGQRPIFVTGMVVYTLARMVTGMADSPALILSARAVQGVGGALLMPVTLSLVITTFGDRDQRVRALGTWSAVGGIAAAAGPVLGGILTQAVGWRSIFFLTIPIGVVAVVASYFLLPAPAVTRPRARLDLVGAVLATAGLAGVVYAVMRSGVVGWTSGEVFVPLLAGLVLMAVFLVQQGRWAADPLMSLSIFRIRTVSVANIVMFLLGLGFFASPILLALYAQDIGHFTPLAAGLAFLPIGGAMFLGARYAGRLTVRFGPRRTAVACCAVGMTGFAGVSAMVLTGSSYWLVTSTAGLVLGLGTAAAFTPITMIATAGVPVSQTGLASGLLNTVRQTSMAIGLAVLSTVTAAAGFATAFLISACCLAAAALVAALALPRTGN